MVAENPGNADQRHTGELGPELRKALEDVLGQSPPEDLMRRTLDGLRQRRPSVARANRRRHSLLSALAVAVSIAVLVLVARHRNGGNREVRPDPPREFVARPVDRLPTYWAYHRASLDSPEALEKLLDRHASELLVSGSESLRMGGFPGFGQEAL
jgi:hypothetical protein